MYPPIPVYLYTRVVSTFSPGDKIKHRIMTNTNSQSNQVTGSGLFTVDNRMVALPGWGGVWGVVAFTSPTNEWRTYCPGCQFH